MKQLLTLGGAIVVLFGLMYGATLLAPKVPDKKPIATTEAVCLPFGHQNLALHIHPTIEIIIDGVKQQIPATVGVSAACMKELHTHDLSGTIHVESVRADRIFEIKHFFEVWGEPFEREGYERHILVNTKELSSSELPLYRMKDRDAIKVIFTKTK